MSRKTKYTKELLQPIVEVSLSWSQVIKALGLKLTGGNYRNIQMHVKFNNLDTSHFTGMLWSKGLTQKDHPALKRSSEQIRIPDDKVFVLNGHPLCSSKISKRLLNHYNWQYKCAVCGLTEWNNKLLSLDLDHINGNNRDNRFINLRFLCPNCHRQTDTWGNKNKL